MALQCADVSVRFGGLAAIEGLSVQVACGEIVGLIGPNGAGKTTAINVLSGFQRLKQGSVTLDGRAISGRRPHAFAGAGIVRTFQSVRLFRRLTVSENVEVAGLGAGLSRSAARKEARRVLGWLGLAHRADQDASGLSYGDERRVGLARALALSPKYLLLDEPAAGLNVGDAEQLRGLIGSIRTTFGCGVLIVEHNMAFISALCDRVHVLAAGRSLADGVPSVVMANPAVRQAYLGPATL